MSLLMQTISLQIFLEAAFHKFRLVDSEYFVPTDRQ